MGNNPQVSISISANAGDSEKYWVRLEQVQTRPEAVSLADAARLIDAFYNVAPCDSDSFGTGGEEAADTTITEEDYYKAALEAVDLSAFCAGDQYWEAQVDVLRSHRQPAYVLHNQPATLVRTVSMRTSKVEQLDVDNANFVDLSWPCERVLSLSGAELHSLRGSTVNFTSPVTGLVTVVYESVWDRVTLRVSLLDANGNLVEADSQSEPAAALVFWRGLAAACAVQRPETEEMYASGSMDRRVRDKLCNPSGSSSQGQGPGNCWQNVQHYRRCQCSQSEAPGTWQTVESAECPEDTKAGTNVGSRRQFAGYVYCEGEEDDVHDPEYYERVCCKPPPRELPICRETRAVWDGNAGIAGGAESYKQRYGDNVQLIAIKPENGCGEKVWQWDTPNKDCCDDITPLSPDPDNPTAIIAGESYAIGVLDGKPGDLIWTAHGGLYFSVGGSKVYEVITPARKVTVYAESDGTCPEPAIEVDDGCQPIEMRFVGDIADQLKLPDDDYVVAPEQQFTMRATGGVPPIRWQVGEGITLLSWDQYDGRSVLLEADKKFCGTANISVIDVCGNEASTAVRSTRGHWEAITDFDACSAPWGGTPDGQAVGGGVYSAISGGVQAHIAVVNSGIQNFKAAQGEGLPHRGSCAEAWTKSGRIAPCGYSGAQMITVQNLSPPDCTPYHDEPTNPQGGVYSDTVCFSLCYNAYVRAIFHTLPPSRSYEATNNWWAQVQYVVQMWRWVCPPGDAQ